MVFTPNLPLTARNSDPWESQENMVAPSKVICGDFERTGISIRFYEFSSDIELRWPDEFRRNSLGICLNFQGAATILNGGERRALDENECAIFTVGERLIARRAQRQQHCFYLIELSCTWMQRYLTERFHQLRPPICRFVQSSGKGHHSVSCMPMPTALMRLRTLLREPPVPEGAEELWLWGKLFEVLSHVICSPHQAVSPKEFRNKERIEKVRRMIDENVATPPSLESIARSVGCSMYHLSRTFKQGMGMNISDYQRAASMEVAIDCLCRGMTVSETARRVGYRSVSAFIRVFQMYYHMTPGLWVARLKESEAAKGEGA